MTDLYIATPTQVDYDALMRLAEAKGYKWCSGSKPTEEHKFHRYGCETVVRMRKNMFLEYCDKPYYEDYQGVTIETIPNLAKIKAIWRVQPDNHKAFFKGKSYNHPLPSDESVIMLEMTDELAEGLMDIYKALAVEYKPQESKAMNKKVKLPRNVIDTFRPELDSPGHRISLIDMRIISDMYNRTLEGVTSDVTTWLHGYDNQWKLIDALRHGYEAEPEPRWGIKAGNCYMNYAFHNSFSNDIDEGFVFYNKSAAEYKVNKLGFGEVVDLNKEVEAYD